MHKKNIYSVQILRAFAALVIAFSHFHHEFIEKPGGFNLGALGFGVDVFFVISGFIMLHISWDQFGKPGASLDFMMRRLARIAPMYWLMTGIMLLLIIKTQPLAQADLSMGPIIGSFLFFPVARPAGDTSPVLTVGWTLNFEMFFYVLFAFALLLRRSVGVTLISLLLLSLVSLRAHDTFAGWAAPQVWSNPMVLEFILGMLLAMAYRAKVSIPLPLAVCLIVAGALVSWFTLNYFTALTRPMIYGSAALSIVGAAVLGRWGPLRSWAKPLVILGDASYVLYLIHPLWLMWPKFFITARWIHLHARTQTWHYLFWIMVLSIVSSVLINRFVEVPLTRWLVAVWSGKKTLTPPGYAPAPIEARGLRRR